VIDGMFVFDQHCHAFRPRQMIWGTVGQTYDDQVARMDRNGIDMSQTMAIFQLTPEQQREETDYTIEAIQAYPDRLIGYVWVTPMWGDRALEELRYAHEHGLRGMKLYAPGQGNFPLDSPLLDPLMELALELGMFTMCHTDVDSKVCSPLLGARLAQRHPENVVVLSHMGMNSDVTHFVPGWVQDIPNCYLDTSATPNLPEFVFKTPMQVIPDRMLFGTDAPTISPEAEITKLRVAEELYGLTREEKAKVLGRNAAKLYGIDVDEFERSHS
jgi:uncharacterized protein